MAEAVTREARLDLDRSRRIDLPEAIYCVSKTVEQCVDITTEMLAKGTDAVIATRVTPDQHAALLELEPAVASPTPTQLSTLVWRPRRPSGRRSSVIAAGTSDLPVANEARLTLEALGHEVKMTVDVGVAGLHRLLDALPELDSAEVVVAIAGMEGALPTVLAGLIAQPLIAVPTSVGYGTAFEGQTALFGMLASCAPGIAVVGIDNGYGAACAAHRVLSGLGSAADPGVPTAEGPGPHAEQPG